MKAYILCNSPLGSDFCGEAEYILANEDKTIFRRWCSNRSFALNDLTRGAQSILEQNGITSVYSNGLLVWIEGVMTGEAEVLFQLANYEYELLNNGRLDD